MNYRRYIFFAMLYLSLCAQTLFAFQIGSSGVTFLKMGAGARAVAMGEAFVAVCDDATSAYWNPAGLVGGEKSSIHFTHNQWLQEVDHEFLSFAFPWDGQFLALSVNYNSVGDIEYRTGPTSEPLGSVSAHDLALALSYARPLNTRMAVGATLKYLHEKIYLDTSSGAALDLGMKYALNNRGAALGISVRNMGTMSRMREERIELPLLLQAGFSWRTSLRSVVSGVILAGDYVTEEFEEHYINLGTELQIGNVAALRLGYQAGYSTKNISAGIGFIFGRYRLNYAYVPYRQDLGTVQRFSMSIEL